MSLTSIFQGIDKALHTAAAWFEKECSVLAQNAPAIQAVADRTLPWAKLAVDGALTMSGNGVLTPAANAIVDTINKDIDVACATIYDVGPTAGVANLINGISQNVTALQGAMEIKNPQSQQVFQNVVNSLQALAQAMTKQLPAPAAA